MSRIQAVQRPAELLSTKQAADYLGVCPNTVRKYADEGKIKRYRIGVKLFKFDRQDLDRLIYKADDT